MLAKHISFQTSSVHAVSIVLFLIKIYSFSLELFKEIRRVREIWSTYQDKKERQACKQQHLTMSIQADVILDRNEEARDGGHSGAAVLEMEH